MTAKKYDPLWEIVNEKIALQDQESDVDVPCPHCHVLVHLSQVTLDGQRVTCGLCGGLSRVVVAGEGRRLEPLE